VPRLADWCAIDMLGEEGMIEQLAVAHGDPAKLELAKELRARYPAKPDAPLGVAKVLRTGEAEFFPEISDELLVTATGGDEQLLATLRGLGLRYSICVPLIARGRVLGALTLVSAESARRYTLFDLELAEQLARRTATAVDNALLFEAAEQGARAAQALDYVAEAVVLLDSAGCVRYWNPAASKLTGISEASALGDQAEVVIPGWSGIEQQLVGRDEGAAPLTIPVSLNGEEHWLAVSRTVFAGGSVFALHDVTDERALEQARSELIATASHELRTPTAAVYGAAKTLLREDIDLSGEERLAFLKVIETEGERLARIVNQILLAGQLDENVLQLAPALCDLAGVTKDAIESAALDLADRARIRLRASKALPRVRCDADRIRQVLGNLLENAIKYSPDGGTIEVRLRPRGKKTVLLEVADRGIGIPASQQERIFDKFHRLDPTQTRGVGGAGLGLYITRELVNRMGGRITVRSRPGAGATFSVELPAA
jgi:PAS domain S-box-containing protein